MYFGTWNDLANRAEDWDSLKELVAEGNAILRYQEALVESMIARAGAMVLAGYLVPVTNAPVLHSEVGERLLALHPEAPFVATMAVDGEGKAKGEGKVRMSLRGRKDGVNVAKIAEMYGGGGHPQAAGFVLPDQVPGKE